MANGEDGQRISVSREALRADLAEMELRLERVIVEGLAKKADREMADGLGKRLLTLEMETALRAGPLTERIDTLEGDHRALKSRIRSEAELRQLIRDERTGRQASEWVWYARVSSVVLTLVALAGLYVTLRYGGVL
jgi:hypothetical protein